MTGKTIEQQLADAKDEIKDLNQVLQYHKERAAHYKGLVEAYEAVLSAAGLLKKPEIPNGE